MQWLARLAVVFLVLAGAGSAQQGQKRIALVIGVADYNLDRRIDMSESASDAAARAGQLPDLRNSVNDARDMRDALTRLRFDSIDYAENPTAEDMIVKLSAFGAKVANAGPGAVVFVYFSGHGLQVEGENFLVPAGAKMPAINYAALSGPASQALLARVAIPMDLLRTQLTARVGAGVNIVVLDACRNNPWDPATRSAGRGGRGRGLADQNWGLGQTLIAFSTQPGNTAYDGPATDRNSPYTLALKAAIEQPGADIWRMFNDVSRAVESRTVEWRDGAQRPWINSVTVPPDVCLAGCEQPRPARGDTGGGDAIDPEQADLYFWNGCCRRTGAVRGDFEGYLTRVRGGELPGLFREIAEARVATMAPSGAPSATGLIRGAEAEPALAAGALTNDPLSQLQWFLRAPGSGPGQSPGGAGFVTAWLKLAAPGLRPVVVSVIDTGIERNQPDLAGNLVAGIDVVADLERAADGDGVDADPSDPGDACGPNAENSYHGTHVAGLIAAQTSNRLGVAGAGRNAVRVQPVRAIGRCGGALSDIVTAIRWAAGVPPASAEAGVQIVNQTPGDIILLSLSLTASCPASMQAAIDAAVARGAVIVAAVGNKATQARTAAPANCRNVIVVAASTIEGSMAFYSNFGPEVHLMAPGGDSLADRNNDGMPDAILSTRSATKDCRDPLTNQPAQTCHYSYVQGGSSAAALVAAGMALRKARTGETGPALQEAFLARAVRAVPQSACTIECSKNQNATPIEGQPGMCLRACGRGILDMTNAL